MVAVEAALAPLLSLLPLRIYFLSDSMVLLLCRFALEPPLAELFEWRLRLLLDSLELLSMMCLDDFFRSFELFWECCWPDDEILARDLGPWTDCLIMIFYS